MNLTLHAVRVGVSRGWTEFRLSLRSPEDLTFYLVWGLGVLVYVYLNRNTELEGTTLTFPVLALPGLLAAMVIFGAVVGPAFALVIEREDGTLLRAKAAPRGTIGYVTGQVVLQSLGVLPMLLILLVPSFFLFEDLMHRGATGWLALAGFLLLGLVAGIPLGMVIGSLARKPSHVSTWGLFPVLGMAAISGIFTPLSALWGWVQGIAQVLPMYWLGVGMRWAFLPDEAAVLEVGGRWRVVEALVVLGAWAAVGLLVAPVVLRRMARRESGSLVEARREERMQRIG
ncbi:ABC transporter permease [Actinotalea sp. K2]|uniref:ABC transporter permease n=1 Tax=Actinotalea sp. K2 TaxID=2939438 RepID=UPI002016E1F7|nr:ABC transporter permease [Actinotalea sp. K2]MCL3859525.1 ABC transporter permease [Actinotalea sp. K2]